MDPVRADPRGRAAHDRVANAAGPAAHAHDAGGHRGTGPARGGRPGRWRSFAARAAQGHIGRARALAGDEQVRLRRSEVLAIPGTLRDLTACFIAAQNLLDAASADAASITDALDAAELAQLNRAYGEGATGAMAARVKRTASAATKDLETRQKSRRTRTVRDQIDRALLDLTGLYRDVLVLQTHAEVELINDEMLPTLERMAVHSDVPATMVRLDALDHARLGRGGVRGPTAGAGGVDGDAGAGGVSADDAWPCTGTECLP